MKPRLPLLSLAAALLLAFGAIATACGDGGPSLEEYFLEFEAISDDAEERFDALEPQFETLFDPAATDEEQLAAAQDIATAFAAIIRDVLPEIEDLEPPGEAEEAHNEFVAAAEALTEVIEGFRDRAAEFESAEELFAEFESPEFSEASDRFDDACFDLQDLADDNDIDVDLQCEDE